MKIKIVTFSVVLVLLSYLFWAKTSQPREHLVESQSDNNLSEVQTTASSVAGDTKEEILPKVSTETEELQQENLSGNVETSRQALVEIENLEIPVPSIIQASDPNVTGVKARIADILEKDEFYCEEYRSTPFKGELPIPNVISFADGSWKASLGASVCGKALIRNGEVLVATYDCQVMTFDLKTGRLNGRKRTWYQPIGHPVDDGQKVIIPQRNGNMTSFQFTPLMPTWNARSAVSSPEGELDISISAVVKNGKNLYVSKHWGNIYIHSTIDGVLKSTPGVLYESRITTPAIFLEGGFVFGNIAGELHAFDLAGEAHRWSMEIESGYPISVLVNGEYCYVLSTTKILSAFSIKDRTLKWSIPVVGYGFDSLSMSGKDLLVGAGSLYKISETGEVIWELRSEGQWGYCRGPVLQGENNIIAGTQEGPCYLLDGRTGNVLRQISPKINGEVWSPLSWAEGYLMMSNNESELYGIKVDLN